jgi:hypothetical protein
MVSSHDNSPAHQSILFKDFFKQSTVCQILDQPQLSGLHLFLFLFCFFFLVVSTEISIEGTALL